jgi:hypothetical protein
MIRRSRAVAALLMGLAACANQPQGVTVSGSEVSRNGCSVNVKEVCEAFFSQNQIRINGEKTDRSMLEQNWRPHEDFVLPYNYPDGQLLATVSCQVDTKKRTVTQAHLLAGPPIDDKAIDYLRSQGFCGEQAPDYRKSMEQAVQIQ